ANPCYMDVSRLGLVLAAYLVVSTSVSAQTSSASSGVDLHAIDKAADPCQNFYQYACGNWIKENPIPPNYSRWGRFNELQERNQEVLKGILKDSAKHQNRSPIEQKIGAFYEACMNEGAVDKAGYDPIKPGIERILALPNKETLAGEIAALHQQGASAFFTF